MKSPTTRQRSMGKPQFRTLTAEELRTKPITLASLYTSPVSTSPRVETSEQTYFVRSGSGSIAVVARSPSTVKGLSNAMGHVTARNARKNGFHKKKLPSVVAKGNDEKPEVGEPLKVLGSTEEKRNYERTGFNNEKVPLLKEGEPNDMKPQQPRRLIAMKPLDSKSIPLAAPRQRESSRATYTSETFANGAKSPIHRNQKAIKILINAKPKPRDNRTATQAAVTRRAFIRKQKTSKQARAPMVTSPSNAAKTLASDATASFSRTDTRASAAANGVRTLTSGVPFTSRNGPASQTDTCAFGVANGVHSLISDIAGSPRNGATIRNLNAAKTLRSAQGPSFSSWATNASHSPNIPQTPRNQAKTPSFQQDMVPETPRSAKNPRVTTLPTGTELLMYGKISPKKREGSGSNSASSPTITRASQQNIPGGLLRKKSTAARRSGNAGLLKRRSTMMRFGGSGGAFMKKKRAEPDDYEELSAMDQLNTVVRPGNKDVFRSPAFLLRPFGQAWHRDIVAFYSNAVRYESRGLFYIIYCLKERDQETLETGDIESFYAWFDAYFNMVTTVLSVLDTTFRTWVQTLGSFQRSSTTKYLSDLHLWLQNTLRRAVRYQERILKLQPPEAVLKVERLFRSYGQKLLDYLTRLEDECSLVLEVNGSIDECRLMSKALMRAIRTMPFFSKNLVLLVRWMDHLPETTSLWMREHLTKRTMMKHAIWKRPGMAEECLEYFGRKSNTVPNDLKSKKVEIVGGNSQ